jgi:hypothetical protein
MRDGGWRSDGCQTRARLADRRLSVDQGARDGVDDRADHLLQRGVAVLHDDPARAVPLGQRAVADPQAGLKAAAGQPLARHRPAVGREDLGHLAPPARHRRVDVDQEGQVRPESPRGGGQHRIDLSAGKIAPRLRQHLGGVEVAIRDDHVGPSERRAEHLVGQLDLAGRVEHQLGPRGERHVARVPAKVANSLGHLGGEGPLLAQMLDREAALAQHLGDAIRDRRLAAAIDPLEDDKHLFHLTQQRKTRVHTLATPQQPAPDPPLPDARRRCGRARSFPCETWRSSPPVAGTRAPGPARTASRRSA